MSGDSTRIGTPAAIPVLLLAAFLQACGGGGGGDSAGGDGDSGGSGGGGSDGGQDPDPPSLSIGDAQSTEGNGSATDLVFDLVLSSAAAEAVTVDYATADQGAAAGEDYTEVDGTLTIPAGQTSASIAVPIHGDACYEEDETFSVMLTNPSSNALLDTAVAIGTIGNDDNKPELTLADAEMPEGDDGTSDMLFAISLDRESCFAIEGTYITNSVTADEHDLAIQSGAFTIPAGMDEWELPVEITGDTSYETDETFTVNLENVSSHVALLDDEAFGTIRTDDLPPVVVLPVEIVEGDDNPRTMIFTVELAGITNEISVDYETSDLTATVADQDYVHTAGTLTIPAGVTTAIVEVEIIGDTKPELHEDLLVTLSNLEGDAILNPGTDRAEGTIKDNDTLIILDPEISVPPGFGFEGGDDNGVTTEMLFQVTLNVPVAGDLVLDYSTSDITAEAGVDYDVASGTVTIPAGDTVAVVPVDVRGDTEAEGQEYFALRLELVTQNLAVLLTPEVTGTILDDDIVGPPFLSVQPVSIFEGDDGLRDLTVFITLGGPATDIVTVDYATADATALAGSDYEAASGSVTFAPGETVQTFPVAIFGDTVIEADERFRVVLSNMTGPAILFEDTADATIESDDPFAMVSIDDVVLVEGDSGAADMLFAVSLDAAAADAVTLDYASADAVTGNSATANDDYVPVNGNLTILPGETEASIAVQINGDTDNEFDETFTITLGNVSQNAELADPVAEGRIINDDETPGWGMAQYFASDRDDNVLPRIAMNAGGEGMLVWAPNTPGPYTSSRYNGGWGSLENPPESLVSGKMRVDREHVIAGGGAATLGWALLPEVAQHTAADGWDDAPFAFDPAGGNQAEFIATAGNEAGSVVVVWKENISGTVTTDHLMFSVYDPATEQWSGEDFIVFEGSIIAVPDVAMNEDGTAVAVWLESAPHASVYDPASATWSTPAPISDELSPGIHRPGYSPQVAIDADGNAIAVWDSGASLGTSVIGDVWASRYDATLRAWLEAAPIDLGALDATYPQVAMDASGNAFVVWLHDNDDSDPWNDTFEIRARRYGAVTNGWGPEVLVQDTNTRVSLVASSLTYHALDMPALAVDPAGNALLAWSEEISGDFVIRASRYDVTEPQPAWSAPEPISDDAYAFAKFPDIASDAAGNAIVVWQAGDDGDFEMTDISQIGWNRYTAP